MFNAQIIWWKADVKQCTKTYVLAVKCIWKVKIRNNGRRKFHAPSAAEISFVCLPYRGSLADVPLSSRRAPGGWRRRGNLTSSPFQCKLLDNQELTSCTVLYFKSLTLGCAATQLTVTHTHKTNRRLGFRGRPSMIKRFKCVFRTLLFTRVQIVI